MDDTNERRVLAYQALRNYCTKLCERGDFQFSERERRILIERLLDCSLAESAVPSTYHSAGMSAGIPSTK